MTTVSRMVGRAYLLGRECVTVRVAFSLPSRRRPLPECPPWLVWSTPPRSSPRNVAIDHPDGTVTVRPFRGLRREVAKQMEPTCKECGESTADMGGADFCSSGCAQAYAATR